MMTIASITPNRILLTHAVNCNFTSLAVAVGHYFIFYYLYSMEDGIQ